MIGDSDEVAVATALFLEEMGIPFKFVFTGDGANWVSVEVVPEQEDPC